MGLEIDSIEFDTEPNEETRRLIEKALKKLCTMEAMTDFICYGAAKIEIDKFVLNKGSKSWMKETKTSAKC